MTPGSSVTANWGLRLLALLLAWGIWFVVRGDVEDDADLDARIVLQLPQGIDGETIPARVSVRLKGTRRDLDTFSAGDPALVFSIGPAELAVDQNSTSRPVQPEELAPASAGRRLAVRVAEITHADGLRVRLWRIERRQVQLAPPVFPGIEELPVRIERSSWPPQATIEGPVDQLSTLLALRTTVDRDQLRQFAEGMGDAPRTSVTLPLTIVDTDLSHLRIVSRERFEVRTELVRNAVRTIELPLHVFGAGARSLRLEAPGRSWFTAGDPARISIELRGGPRALESVAPGSVHAFVLAAEMPEGAEQSELRIHLADLPPGVAPVREDLTVIARVAR